MKAVHCGWAESSDPCYSCLATDRHRRMVGVSRNVSAATLGENKTSA